MLKYYAVKIGRKPGVYTIWSEAQKQINGYPNGDFKSFDSRENAEKYINREYVQIDFQNKEKISETTEKYRLELINSIKKVVEEFERRDINSQDIRGLNKIFKDIINKIERLQNDLEKYPNEIISSLHSALIKYIDYFNSFELKPNSLMETLDFISTKLNELNSECKTLEYLSVIRDKNVVLVGANGSGKSSFASFLKKSSNDNITVIPAQKYLMFNKNLSRLHLSNQKTVEEIHQNDFIKAGRDSEQKEYHVKSYTEDITSIFSKLIATLVNRELHTLVKNKENDVNEESLLDSFKSIWKNLNTDITFYTDEQVKTLKPVRNGKEYNLNAMSDGEKAMIYYICHVLLAKENSIIIVDEPETFLNASNFNRLWDTLEEYASHSKFIYITHVVDFVISRSNSDLWWLKEYESSEEWVINKINQGDDQVTQFPNGLLTEILGAQKPILFCEGTKEREDYKIYSNLFREQLVVQPVGGHKKVIEYTKAYNDSNIFGDRKAFGIIDYDLMDEYAVSTLKKKNVFTLPFNEIEMLLISQEVMTDVLSYFHGNSTKEKIENFKSHVIDVMIERKKKILQEKAKKSFDGEISSLFAEKNTDPEDIISKAVRKIESLGLKEKVEEFEKQLINTLDTKDYPSLLKYCNLKGEVIDGIGNEILEKEYRFKATQRIMLNKNLRDELVEKYFKEFEEMMESSL